MSNSSNASRVIADAERAAIAEVNKRACAIIESCARHGQPQAAAGLILSGKTLDECEAELKRSATAAGWDRAIAGTGQQPQGACGAGWDTAIGRANGGQ